MSLGHLKVLRVCGWYSETLHRESTLRFIPEGYEVYNDLIHFLSHILWRHGSVFDHLSWQPCVLVSVLHC